MKRVWIGKRRGTRRKWRYYVGWYDDRGRQHELAAGSDRKAAERVREQVWRDINGLGPRDSAPDLGPTWEAFVEEDVAAIEATLQPSTVVKTRQILRLFGEVCEPPYVRDVDVPMIERYREWRLKNGVRPATVNADLRHLKASFNRAKARGRVVANPFAAVKLARIPDGEKRILTVEEERRLLSACADPVLHALVYTALRTGMRLGEMLNLEWSDVDLASGEVYLRCKATWRSKSARNRSVCTDARGADLLRELNRQSTSTYVFCPDTPSRTWTRVLQTQFAEAVRNAQIDHVTIHDLRRTNLTRLAEGGMPPAALRSWAGHTEIGTTMRFYVRVNTGRVLEAARRALEAEGERANVRKC